MKQFPWTAESVTFMRRAAEHSEYHAVLAKRIAARLSGRETVFEPGCGIGFLSLELAPYVASVVAADIDPLPLQVLRSKLQQSGITNVTVREQDAFSLAPQECFDAAVFCYFGMPGQILSFAKAHVLKDVFVVKRAYKTHRFAVTGAPIAGDSLDRMGMLLEERHIPFTKELLDLEMGQPFRDLDEARRFFSLYGQNEDASGFSDKQLLSRLVHTECEEFPYFLPAAKQVGLIHFSAEDL